MYKTKDLELLGESYEAVYNEQLGSPSTMYAVENCIQYEGCMLIAICSSLEDAKQVCKEFMEEYEMKNPEEMIVTEVPGYKVRIDELPSSNTSSYDELVDAEDGESSTEGRHDVIADVIAKHPNRSLADYKRMLFKNPLFADMELTKDEIRMLSKVQTDSEGNILNVPKSPYL